MPNTVLLSTFSLAASEGKSALHGQKTSATRKYRRRRKRANRYNSLC